MSKKCDAIIIFPIFGHFRAIQNPDSERRVYKTYVLINNNPLSYKNRKQNQKVSNTAINYALSKGTSFAKKNPEFLEKNADITKIKEILVLKGIFSETNYGCVLTCQI